MVAFLLLFLIPASFTYLSGLLLASAALGTLVEDELAAANAATGRNVLLGACYTVMAFACWIRGKAIQRTWLVAFPIVAAVFDILLVVVPFVPSVMNITVLAAGIPQPAARPPAERE